MTDESRQEAAVKQLAKQLEAVANSYQHANGFINRERTRSDFVEHCVRIFAFSLGNAVLMHDAKEPGLEGIWTSLITPEAKAWLEEKVPNEYWFFSVLARSIRLDDAALPLSLEKIIEGATALVHEAWNDDVFKLAGLVWRDPDKWEYYGPSHLALDFIDQTLVLEERYLVAGLASGALLLIVDPHLAGFMRGANRLELRLNKLFIHVPQPEPPPVPVVATAD